MKGCDKSLQAHERISESHRLRSDSQPYVPSEEIAVKIVAPGFAALLLIVLMTPAFGQTADVRPEDVASPEAIVLAGYDALAREPGENFDWDRFRGLFLPGALMIPSTEQRGGEFDVLTVQDFIDWVGGWYAENNPIGGPNDQGFQEEEIATVAKHRSRKDAHLLVLGVGGLHHPSFDLSPSPGVKLRVLRRDVGPEKRLVITSLGLVVITPMHGRAANQMTAVPRVLPVASVVIDLQSLVDLRIWTKIVATREHAFLQRCAVDVVGGVGRESAVLAKDQRESSVVDRFTIAKRGGPRAGSKRGKLHDVTRDEMFVIAHELASFHCL